MNISNLSRTNCETFCNMMLFNLPHSTQASHTTGCIRGDLRWDFKQYFWTNDLKYLEWSYDEVCDFSVGIEVQRGAKHEYRNYTKKYLIVSEEFADLDLIRVWKHMKKKRTLMEVMDMFHRILISHCQGNLKALQKLYFMREKIADVDENTDEDYSNSAL